ncbi:MAG: hypothetical protein M3Q90_02205 [Candidatus Dormibacteraeota bacterium]|nr:hypothetical protein [Candidatus Dormibacteraeota bacterium]
MSTESPTTATPSGRLRQPILYADQLWRQQRFFAGFLVAVGLVMTILLIYQGQITKSANVIWLLYVPSGLLLGGAFLLYKRRSYVEALDSGMKVSMLRSSLVIEYDRIKGVKVQPLKLAFLDKRTRMVAPMMKPLLEKPALFVRVRGSDEELAALKKRLGSRMMFEDTIALPLGDADAVAWEIGARLPYRLGQNQGGGKRHKRRR